MNKYPGVTVSAQFVGSSAGVEAVLGQNADIGNSSRNLKDEEKANGAVALADEGRRRRCHPDCYINRNDRQKVVTDIDLCKFYIDFT